MLIWLTDGYLHQQHALQQRLSYLPGEIACMDETTGAAFLKFMASMKKLRDRMRARKGRVCPPAIAPQCE